MYSQTLKRSRNRAGLKLLAESVILGAVAVLSVGCAHWTPQEEVAFIQGLQQVNAYTYNQNLQYAKDQQEKYIRARQGALPMRQTAPMNTGTSQVYPMAPVNPAYTNNPSQQFLLQGFQPSGGF